LIAGIAEGGSGTWSATNLANSSSSSSSLALEARDEAEDLLKDLAQGDAAVHGRGLPKLV
jgi:hypothetical protein